MNFNPNRHRKKFASQKHCPSILLLLLAFLPFLAQAQIPELKTGYAYDPRCSSYVHYPNHVEAPGRVLWIHKRLQETKLLSQLSLLKELNDPMPHVRKVHTEEHIKGIHSIPRDSAATEKIGPIADLAAALALGAVKAVCEGGVKNAFCNIRPPGHHVTNGGGVSGFCAYANVVIAARYAQEVMNHKRVLIIDWDYHHGNGTVHFVRGDTNVMFFEVGCEGCSSGANDSGPRRIITKGISSDGGNEEYISIWKNHLLPAAELFKPDIVLISCGFDLKKNDGLGGYGVTAHGVSRLTKMAMDIAQKHCDGKLVSLLEGGYHDGNKDGRTWFGLSQCAENHVRTLMTGTVQSETPFFLSMPIINPRHQISNPPELGTNSLLFQGVIYITGNQHWFDLKGRSVLHRP